ncbi:MAG: hypothetical protein R2873_00820 [Caldilineaceae bacterium]
MPAATSSPPTTSGTHVDDLPLDANSALYIEAIGAETNFHPDFGSGTWNDGPIGIPYVDVAGTQPAVAINFTAYGDESDPGPYPVPTDAPIEGARRATATVMCWWWTATTACSTNSTAFPQPDGSWDADSAARYDLSSHELRPAGWTSADAAGLPILPGLVRYDEVAAGEIRHAIRFTAPQTRCAYVWPARHFVVAGRRAIPAHGAALPSARRFRRQQLCAGDPGDPGSDAALRHHPGR